MLKSEVLRTLTNFRNGDSVHSDRNSVINRSISKLSATRSDDGSNVSTIIARPATHLHASKYSVNSSQPRTTDTVCPRDNLSKLGRQFAEVPEFDYVKVWKFLMDHQDRVDFDENDLQQATLKFLERSDKQAARRCAQQSILLRQWLEIGHQSARDKYFQKLQEVDKGVLRAIIKDFDTLFDRLKERSTHGFSRPDLAERKQGGPQRHLGTSLRTLEPTYVAMPIHSERQDLGAATRNHAPLAMQQTLMVRESSSDALEDPYQIRPSAFFRPGRVLSIVLHETAHSIDEERSSNRSYGSVSSTSSSQNIYSVVRTMVIVKARHGYSWAVPISSYSGKGTATRGLSQSDIAQHAIICAEGTRPMLLPNEPELVKKPLTMIPADRSHRLNQASRIHFGKVHTVEHNTKIKNVGMIHKDSMQSLNAYFKESFEAD
jgi:hypothetical protein